jgi:beta-glucanase (GH16 family)
VDMELTSETGPAPTTATTEVHEYRIDWTPTFTAFYVDGVLQKKYTTNVPSAPGPWLWNNWSNGSPGEYLTVLSQNIDL